MLVRNPHGDQPQLETLTVQSPIVGALEGMDDVNGTFVFETGDLIFLYTDGTAEARQIPRGTSTARGACARRCCRRPA